MKYNFIETNNLKEDFLNRHNLDLDKYNNFDFNINEDIINDFYNKLILNRDLKFLIVGDYDCDGICSTTIMKNLLTSLNIEHSFYIPSRLKEGYGLNKLIVDNAIKHNYKAIILVDNGVTCTNEIEYAYKNNIKVFIVDHHNFIEKPRCEAMIHQSLLNKEFEYASAGELCFLLSLKYSYNDFNLILGGLSILSDYILINSFNRFIIKKMFDLLNENEYVSLNLLNGSDNYTNTSITFNIIPKINSISRMESKVLNPNHIVKFLISEYDNLSDISKEITSLNNLRKKDTSNLFNEIIKEDFKGNYILIASKEINEGYTSSLATKLSNYYDKPVFVLSICDGLCKGSGRAQNIDLFSLAKDFDKYISFGGHEHAVGVSIKDSDLDSFKSYLNNINFIKTNDNLQDVYLIDPELINDELIDDIESLGPFGNGYECPLICLENKDYDKSLLKGKYTKFFINDNLSCITFDEKFIGFNPEYIIGYIEKDSYRRYGFSMIIKDLV